MKIGIDMDDTICSTKESIIKYQNIFIKDKNITLEELWNNNTYKDEFLNKYLSDIYNNALIKENCVYVLNKLSKDNELYIITARTTNYIDDIIKLTKDYLTNNNINTILFDELDRYKYINNRINNWNELINILNID